MKLFKDISIYRLIALVSALIFLIDSFTGNYISLGLIIDSVKMKNHFQIWRFATYPFAYMTIANALLGFVAFFFFAPKLRKQLSKGIFDFSIMLHTFGIGLVLFMLNINSPEITVMGIEAISTYIITLYILVNRRKDIRYFKTVRLTRMAFPLFLLAGWAAFYLLETGTSELNKNLIDQSPAILAMGIITGLIGFFMMKDEKLENVNINKQNSFTINEIRGLEPTPALIDKYKSNELKTSKSVETLLEFSDADPESNEEIFNELLDKINENGYDSLNEDERSFLKIYAKSI